MAYDRGSIPWRRIGFVQPSLAQKLCGCRDQAFSCGGVQQIRLLQFILRYVVVGSAIFAAYEAGIASLPAMLVGLSSFVVALLVEALREFYFAIIHREEIS